MKKLQVMLRQANDQLEKTMKDKQELEEFVRRSSEESAQQVRDGWHAARRPRRLVGIRKQTAKC